MVEIPWDATEIYGAPEKGQVVVELINMGMIKCKHGWDLHEMGNIKQGSGGSEWVALYNDEFLVRFTAMQAEIIYSENGEPRIRATAHERYCESETSECMINFSLPQ